MQTSGTIAVRPSAIHGQGVFAATDLVDAWIPLVRSVDVPALMSGVEKRTTWGLYVNHADHPNATWKHQGGTWYAHVAHARTGAEITLSYLQGPWFVDKSGAYVTKPQQPGFGIHGGPFALRGGGGGTAYGFPPIVIPVIMGVTALLGTAGAGIGAFSASKSAKDAEYQQAGASNPCVANLNAQIAQVHSGSILTRWASAAQKAEYERRKQLEAQRDAYLANPNSCPAYVTLQQQAADASNLPLYAIGGLFLALSGLAVITVIAKRS